VQLVYFAPELLMPFVLVSIPISNLSTH